MNETSDRDNDAALETALKTICVHSNEAAVNFKKGLKNNSKSALKVHLK